RYSFYDPDCPAAKCEVNQTPPWPWHPHQPPAGFKSQIVRMTPPLPDTEQINIASRAVPAIKDSVWSNYMLVSTQWPSNRACAAAPSNNAGGPDPRPGDQPDATCSPMPPFLANSTLETFSQDELDKSKKASDGIPQASSSCIACHNNATTHAAKTSDFT